MMCFYSRRRQHLKQWNRMELLLNERSIRQSLESKSIYQRSFVPNDGNHWHHSEQMHQLHALMPLVPVTYDHENQNHHTTNTFTPITQAATDVSNETFDF